MAGGIGGSILRTGVGKGRALLAALLAIGEPWSGNRQGVGGAPLGAGGGGAPLGAGTGAGDATLESGTGGGGAPLGTNAGSLRTELDGGGALLLANGCSSPPPGTNVCGAPPPGGD